MTPQEFLRQQAEYRARQQQQQEQQAQQQQQALLAQQAREEALHRQQLAQQQQQQQQQPHSLSVKDTVRDIIANTDFSSFDMARSRSPGAGVMTGVTRSRVIQVSCLELCLSSVSQSLHYFF